MILCTCPPSNCGRWCGRRVITGKIRRSSYHDVVGVSEVQGALDITGVQTYVINSTRVVFLNKRPLPKGKTTFCFGAVAKSPAHVCEICSCTVLDPFHFCSLAFKLQGIKKGRDECFVLAAEGGEGGAIAMTTASVMKASDRTRVRQGTLERGGPPAGGEDGKGLCGAMEKQEMCPARPPSNPHRRKGVLRRAPLAS
ncbi:hypothetical protein Taro_040134 [Colocasia esculenta]|uniref:Uncharacterized protein n=1 Tax=Colocasia esculenta TaxID=4460 RepID=A0A843WPC4_COLES|nr:hypothetical protein [Colocasia esculenta]